MVGAVRQQAPILSVASFRAWLASRPDEEHWELIEGVPMMMMTPPNRRHQRIASNLETLNAALKLHDPALAATRPSAEAAGAWQRAFCERSRAMKTTVELPDDLYRRAEAEAALRGRKLDDLVEQALRLALDAPGKASQPASLAVVMKRARGIVDSGVPDLASNSEHLKGFGRDARHR